MLQFFTRVRTYEKRVTGKQSLGEKKTIQKGLRLGEREIVYIFRAKYSIGDFLRSTDKHLLISVHEPAWRFFGKHLIVVSAYIDTVADYPIG